ncbi:hypothetical protein GCM10023196_020530 [Actinoallomurus vinaceus]|uniref:Uncharacterized protein n=1 Tax=Actinoallomurus vinaceus TaxID=1080074 RepID=A0ABP8U6B7_9ACTN
MKESEFDTCKRKTASPEIWALPYSDVFAGQGRAAGDRGDDPGRAAVHGALSADR